MKYILYSHSRAYRTLILSYMSFNNWNDLERTATNTSTRYSDYPEFASLTKAVENQLAHINTLLVPLKDAYDATKYNNATEAFKKLNSTIKELNDYVAQTEAQREDVEVVGYFKQKEAVLIKLTRDSLGRFQRMQQQQQDLISEDQQAAQATDQVSGQQQQQQVHIEYEPVNSEELEQQTLLIQEREREIHRIQQDTQEINDIFTSLLSIVNEQQFQIDLIENNIFNYSSNAAGALLELRRAERYQRRTGGRMFCCLAILLGVVGFIVLVGVIF